MTKLIWDASGERYFESGISRGVLYPKSGPGVAWNGLVSVDQSSDGGVASPYYLDGFKYHNESTPEEFKATINAFTYPDEFSIIDGTTHGNHGLSYDQQKRQPFDLSYRTGLGNDTMGIDLGYKTHLVYNALAEPSSRSNATHTNSIDTSIFSWNLTTSPVQVSARKPTAHLVIDSTKTSFLRQTLLDNILYGTPTSAPRMPTTEELITLFDDWARLQIQPDLKNGLGKLLYHGLPDLKGDSYKGLYEAPSGSRLKETAVKGLYILE